VILYEYPFNERIRSYLRLEHLFQRLWILIERSDPIDHHSALVTMFEIMDVGARADLKSDVLKDLDRQRIILNAYRGNPAISENALNSACSQIESCFTRLNALTGKAGQALSESDWLMSIRSRTGIPGGTCSFDLPSYHAWQHQSIIERQQRLRQWSSAFLPLAESIVLLLRILRDAGTPQKVIAMSGQFQQMLPQGRTFQLMRLALEVDLQLVPEISGNRMMVSVRLMQKEENDRLAQYHDDAVFEISLCG
jgi:cell division protein ZapD